MAVRSKRSLIITAGAIHALLVAGSILMLLPLFWTVSTALKTLPQLNVWPPRWIPDPVAWSNFPTALTLLPFHLYLKNTLIIVTGVVAGHLLSCSLVAYGFARLRFPGREVLFVLLLSTMMMPFIVRLIPLFVLYTKIGWINTFLPFIVPAFLGTPFYIFLLRQFFRTIPPELSEAARIDGCGELGIWWRIMLPLAKPALAVVAIFSFQAAWDDFLAPLIFLNKPELRTLALGLYSLRAMPGQLPMVHYLMAASLVMIVPVLAVFAAFQRLFVQGVTLTGIKG